MSSMPESKYNLPYIYYHENFSKILKIKHILIMTTYWSRNLVFLVESYSCWSHAQLALPSCFSWIFICRQGTDSGGNNQKVPSEKTAHLQPNKARCRDPKTVRQRRELVLLSPYLGYLCSVMSCCTKWYLKTGWVSTHHKYPYRRSEICLSFTGSEAATSLFLNQKSHGQDYSSGMVLRTARLSWGIYTPHKSFHGCNHQGLI